MGFVRRWFPGRLAERLAWSIATVMAVAVIEVFALGLFWRLYILPAALAFEALVAGTLIATHWRWLVEELSEIATTMRAAIGGKWSPFVALSVSVSAAAWIAALAFTFESPVAGIDAASYHLPIGVLINHHHGLEYFETRCGHVNEFPKNGQMIYARAFLFGGDERHVRPVQWLFGIVAALSIYGWMRNWGASREMAGSAAPLFLLMVPVLAQAMVLWGSIDLIFHAMVILALATYSGIGDDPRQAITRGLWAAAAAGLAMGSKSQGIVLGGMAMAFIFLRVGFLLRRDARRLAFFAVGCGGLLLLLGGYTFIQNMLWFGNPLQPMRVKVLGVTLFKGLFKSPHDLIQTEHFSGSRDNTVALWRSMSIVWLGDWSTQRERLGGFGPAWIFALLPGLIAGTILFLRRRDWINGALGLALIFLLLRFPGSWWARFSIYLFAAALAFTVVVITAMPRIFLQRLVLGWTILLSLAGGVEAYFFTRAVAIPADLQAAPGSFLHSLDALRREEVYFGDEHDLELYRWCRDNLPADSRLVYFHPYWAGMYHYYYYRQDLKNHVFGIDETKTREEFAEALESRKATYFLMQSYLKSAEWADEYGPVLFRTGKYTIHRYEPK